MNSLAALVLVSLATVTIGVERTLLESHGDSIWGKWGDPEFCPDGSFVVGFMIKQEEPQNGDDTATNAVRLFCDDHEHSSVMSSEGQWGSWNAGGNCANSRRIWGFRLQSEGNQHFGDDTAVNGVEFICGGGQTIGYTGRWGDWKSWNYCPVGHGICGIRTKVEGQKVLGFETDNVALTDIEAYCCPMACTSGDCAIKASD